MSRRRSATCAAKRRHPSRLPCRRRTRFLAYLNTRAVGEEREFLGDGGRVKLERLRSFRGAQTYRLPPGMEPADFHTVTIWCESFSMYIGSGAIVATSAAEEGRARAA